MYSPSSLLSGELCSVNLLELAIKRARGCRKDTEENERAISSLLFRRKGVINSKVMTSEYVCVCAWGLFTSVRLKVAEKQIENG